MTTRASKTLGLLIRNLKSCSSHIKNIAYKTLVRPQLEYFSPIWDSYEKGHILYRLSRYNDSNIGWQSLEKRRSITRLTFMYKIVLGLVDISFSPLLPTGRQARNTSLICYIFDYNLMSTVTDPRFSNEHFPNGTHYH